MKLYDISAVESHLPDQLSDYQASISFVCPEYATKRDYAGPADAADDATDDERPERDAEPAEHDEQGTAALSLRRFRLFVIEEIQRIWLRFCGTTSFG